jgi:hypothetical protein
VSASDVAKASGVHPPVSCLTATTAAAAARPATIPPNASSLSETRTAATMATAASGL